MQKLHYTSHYKVVCYLESNVKGLVELCEDLNEMCNLSKNQTKSFIELIVADILHNVAMDCAESDGKIVCKGIVIPNIGYITVRLNPNGEIVESHIELDDSFREGIENAINKFESPLIDLAKERVVEKLRTKYESLL